jgi:hypothetical protein
MTIDLTKYFNQAANQAESWSAKKFFLAVDALRKIIQGTTFDWDFQDLEYWSDFTGLPINWAKSNIDERTWGKIVDQENNTIAYIRVDIPLMVILNIYAEKIQNDNIFRNLEIIYTPDFFLKAYTIEQKTLENLFARKHESVDFFLSFIKNFNLEAFSIKEFWWFSIIPPPEKYVNFDHSNKLISSLLSDSYKTQLGTIGTWIESNTNPQILIDEDNSSSTGSHKINLQSFELPNEFQCNSLSPTKKVESLIGWRWFIEKISDTDEQLNIFCQLIDSQAGVSCDPDSGEALDAVEIENENYHLHIGTEDEEVLQARAKVNDFMPKRFYNLLGWHWHENRKKSYYYSFVEYIDLGIKINIPNLLKGEKIYFHFLVATNRIKPSEEDPRYMDVSTWLAVDRSKRYLDEYLNGRNNSN